MSRMDSWTTEETILLMQLYSRVGSAVMETHDEVIDLSKTLRNGVECDETYRSPDSVCMKLRGLKQWESTGANGLPNVGNSLRVVWERFHKDGTLNREPLAEAARAILVSMGNGSSKLGEIGSEATLVVRKPRPVKVIVKRREPLAPVNCTGCYVRLPARLEDAHRRGASVVCESCGTAT